MFELLKAKNDIYAPIKGRCFDISECEDKVFSSKMMGDGFYIEPEDNVVLAPCDGKVVGLFPTKHAVMIKMRNNKQIMIHVGLDTVKLQGKGLASNIKIGDRIKKGQPLIEFDMDYIKSQDIKIPIIVIMMEDKSEYAKMKLHEIVTNDNVIIRMSV